MQPLFIYNTLTRKKEEFKAINAPLVGMYVCGPTVYSDVHLGNCRTFISFDMMYRYLVHIGYKVRYVRNITDAGHLEGDRDEGDDKFTKKAKIEQVEPMEIVQRYTLGFRDVMQVFNTLPPSIEPTATGHIVEQIAMTKTIIENGYAYEVNGTIYFDVEKFAKSNNYGKLTNRQLDDLLNNSRELNGQDEKRGKLDFALWIKAKPEHLMQWESPWGSGFPGWHIECSAMSKKYLGETFDIHGGGMDLQATHHTNEIAQNIGFCKKEPANYWIHTNMLTVNGARMGKSAGNSFLPYELFTGAHPLLAKGFNPMTVKFFMYQTHYRSTLDFSNEALLASEKGYQRLLEAYKKVNTLNTAAVSTTSVDDIIKNAYQAMNDDFNTSLALASIFEAVRYINSIADGKETISQDDKEKLETFLNQFLNEVLGLIQNQQDTNTKEKLDKVINVVLELRNEAKQKKDWQTSDVLRDKLADAGIVIKDTKEGTSINY